MHLTDSPFGPFFVSGSYKTVGGITAICVEKAYSVEGDKRQDLAVEANECLYFNTETERASYDRSRVADHQQEHIASTALCLGQN